MTQTNNAATPQGSGADPRIICALDLATTTEAAALVERRIREVRAPLPLKADWAARLAQKYPGAAERLLAAP